MKRMATITALAAALLAPIVLWSAEFGDTLQEVLDKVDARCPEHFPDKIQPVPSKEVLAEKSTAELFEMIDTWNNVTSKRVAGALGKRGPEVLPKLQEALASKCRQTRVTAVRAIHSVVNRQAKEAENKKKLEGKPHWREIAAAGAQVRKKYLYLVPGLAKLTNDPYNEVRRALVGTLNLFRDESKEATHALTMLWNDSDEYLAESAIRSICYRGYGWPAFAKLSKEQRLAAVRRGFASELGSGRQCMMEIVKRLSKEEKQALVPDMLKNLTVHPDRNMMFRDGGRWGCMEFLTELKVKEVIPPMFATLRTERSDFLFDAAAKHVRTFDPDTRKLAVPDLKKYIEDLERRKAYFNEYITHVRSRDGVVKGFDGKLAKARKLLEEIEAGAAPEKGDKHAK